MSFSVKFDKMGEMINHVKEKVDKLEVDNEETKTDLVSYKDVLMKNVESQILANPTIDEHKIKNTIEKALVINQRDRSKNVIIFGLDECENGDIETLVKEEILKNIYDTFDQPVLVHAVRIGKR